MLDEYKSDSKGYKGWCIKAAFNANGKTCETAYENDEKNLYVIGDSIDILYLPDYPRIYEFKFQLAEE